MALRPPTKVVQGYNCLGKGDSQQNQCQSDGNPLDWTGSVPNSDEAMDRVSSFLVLDTYFIIR